MGMTKYKLHKHDTKIYKDWWVFPLALQVFLNDMLYKNKNIEITIHFLCFHIRWLFLEAEDGNDD